MLGLFWFFFQAEDGIRDLVRSRGLGDVYKRQILAGVMLKFGIYGFLRFAMPLFPAGAAELAPYILSLIHI